jgi:hypothetical protein
MGIHRQLAAVALYFRFFLKNARMLPMELPVPAALSSQPLCRAV